MITAYHIKQIEKILNNESIIKYKLLQVSFGIACLKFELSNNNKFIAKFFIKKNQSFNAIKSELDNLIYLNKKKLIFFPKIIKKNNNYLIMQYFENDVDKPSTTKKDLLQSIIKIHSVSSDLYGFNFNTQIGGIKQVNDYEDNWVNFYTNKRLNSIFELANKKEYLGSLINKKITFILNNMINFIPKKPTPRLLHGDLWEGNILFKKKKICRLYRSRIILWA